MNILLYEVALAPPKVILDAHDTLRRATNISLSGSIISLVLSFYHAHLVERGFEEEGTREIAL